MFGLREIDNMNAAEIRKRAEAAKRKGPDVKHLIERVTKRIDEAADAGEMAIVKNPLDGLRCMVSTEEFAAVWNYFRGRGFVVKLKGGKFAYLSWKKAVSR
jgi:hypothetical protein